MAWVLMTLAISGMLWCFASGQTLAGFCSSASCSLALTNSNFIGTGTFGTVNLALSSNVVTVDVRLDSNYRIVNTGFPGSFGFTDSLGGGLTIGSFKTSGVPTSFYSGYQSQPAGCTTKDCHWALFGYANNAAATSGPNRPDSLQELSFMVSKGGASITDVRQLLRQFDSSPGSAREPVYFVVDGCSWNSAKRSCNSTGLFAVTQVPEPASLVLLASGFLALGLARWKRMI